MYNTVTVSTNNPHTKLDRLRVELNSFKSYYPKRDTLNCKLDSDMYYRKNRAMGFYDAYNVAKRSENNKELCAAVGSMICSVLTDLKTSAKSALESITGEEYLSLLQKLPLQWPRFSRNKSPTPVVPPMD